MVSFRKHTLQAVIVGDSTEDARTGKIIPGATATIEFPCRLSPNGSGQEVRDTDGNRVVYSYMIHADRDATKIPFGTTVSVLHGGEVLATGKVLHTFTNGLNTRIWI